MLSAFLIAIGLIALFGAGYLLGIEVGRQDIILDLLTDEIDFKQFLAYRKTGGHDAELLQKLVNCLRNDFGLVAEWDGLRKLWTIEVEHAEESNH